MVKLVITSPILCRVRPPRVHENIGFSVRLGVNLVPTSPILVRVSSPRVRGNTGPPVRCSGIAATYLSNTV